MRIATIVARYLLGLLLTIFGLNGFFNFLPATPMPGTAVQFFTMLVTTHYMVFVFVLQIVSGLLFLANRYVPLALTLIGPVLVNILLFHITMNPSGIVPGAVATICWLIVFASVRPAFDGIFRSRAVARI
jgi:putative oxidoreductase